MMPIDEDLRQQFETQLRELLLKTFNFESDSDEEDDRAALHAETAITVLFAQTAHVGVTVGDPQRALDKAENELLRQWVDDCKKALSSRIHALPDPPHLTLVP
jgi:hypothetical protein